jgi:hypothetical protein
MIIASLRLGDNKKRLAPAKLGLLFKIPEAYWKLLSGIPRIAVRSKLSIYGLAFLD